ncbi:hypothetical protein [Enterococcus mundtii]|uniref:hypothetical protein n=1 Tax=Enterococcus mundtii TaxID=53346 RepID=UPI002DB5634B|nr:hypothetical protein [Enterococcus mundtii]MEC3940117.1 hypothetical protein [Enterococcus mundtii]
MSFIFAFDVSKGESYKVLYHNQQCLTEGKVSHHQEEFRQLLEEITVLPETPKIIFEAIVVSSPLLKKCYQSNRLANCLLKSLERGILALSYHLKPNKRREQN